MALYGFQGTGYLNFRPDRHVDKMTSLNDIRSTFLDYFGRHDHEIVDSSPLVPRNDPTLMFVNSGMVQFLSLIHI